MATIIIEDSEDEFTSVYRNLKRQREIDTSCSLCLETYTNPRILPCLHTFCHDCITRLITHEETDDSRCLEQHRKITDESLGSSSKPASSSTEAASLIKCPECRSTYPLPANGVDGFLPNTQIMREISKTKKAKLDIKSCGTCTASVDEPTASYCSTCCEYLCNACHQSHTRMKMFQTHVITSPDEANSVSDSADIVSYKCSEHPEEELKVFCSTCEAVVCNKCALYDHECYACIFKPVEEVAEEIRTSAKNARTSAALKLAEFKTHAENVKEDQKYVSEFPSKLKQHISHTFDASIKQLELRKQKFLTVIDKKFERHSKSVLARKDTTESTICSLEASINFVDRILQSDNSLELAVLGSIAIPQLQSLSKISWKPRSIALSKPTIFVPSISHSAETFQQQINSFGSILHGKKNSSRVMITIDKIQYYNKLSGHLSDVQPRKKNPGGTVTEVAYKYDYSYVIKILIDPAPIKDSFPSCIAVKAFVKFRSLRAVVAETNEYQKVEANFAKNPDDKRSWNLSFTTNKKGEYHIRVILTQEEKKVATASTSILFN